MILRAILAQAPQGEQPHRQIVEVLSVAIGRFADANAARTAQHTLDFGDEPLGLVEVAFVVKLPAQGDKQDHAESIGP